MDYQCIIIYTIVQIQLNNNYSIKYKINKTNKHEDKYFFRYVNLLKCYWKR